MALRHRHWVQRQLLFGLHQPKQRGGLDCGRLRCLLRDCRWRYLHPHPVGQACQGHCSVRSNSNDFHIGVLKAFSIWETRNWYTWPHFTPCYLLATVLRQAYLAEPNKLGDLPISRMSLHTTSAARVPPSRSSSTRRGGATERRATERRATRLTPLRLTFPRTGAFSEPLHLLIGLDSI